jgi:hydrogenase expression/formation protein HypE
MRGILQISEGALRHRSDEAIAMAHGSGGSKGQELIREVFAAEFSNPMLDEFGDSAIVEIPRSRLAYTTDSYVVKPIFFPGGDIGKLAVCGTVNDLAAAGARALYITAGFMIEEGFPIDDLKRIASSMAATAKRCGVHIVAGDTKVVERGGLDGIFINTSGIGVLFVDKPITRHRIAPGDSVLISGYIGDHGIAIMSSREGLSMETAIESDCAPLTGLVEHLAASVPDIKFLRDPTRGGLATVLCEAAQDAGFGIEIAEDKIPIRDGTRAACEILGIDPLYVANEGKMVAVVPGDRAALALAAMQAHPLGRDASIIGSAVKEHAGEVSLITAIGTRRLIVMQSGEQLPRIC